ncbi:MAG: DEAD/DEAH box helicase [Pseudomonadales bacterium]|nr:DEAD/DEAH box helicase [Pseudomonadales bacterium]
MFSDLDLHESLHKALEKMNFSQPTPVQEAVIPVALTGVDLQVSAETGSGKTAAYVLPALQHLLRNPAPDTATRCLVLVPTRELAQQVFKDCQLLAQCTSIKAEAVTGGASFNEQKALIRKNPEILIGTPGRLLEHVQKKSIELKDLDILVLDEADRMLDMGFREDVLAIVAACNSKRQTLLLSATLRHDGIGRIAGHILQTPHIVDLGSAKEQHSSIVQQIIIADDLTHKEQLCTWLLAHEKYGKVLIFSNTREHADKLASLLRYHKQRVASLHGDMQQDERTRVMNLFRSGAVKVLVATDLAARGLDVKGVDLVINFAMARSGDEYVHRIGRTGRAGEQGLAISLIAPQEWNLMSGIERYLGLSFERRVIKELPARFQGPKKKKIARKDRDKKNSAPAERGQQPKFKERHRYKKNIGKRRKPADKADTGGGPGKGIERSIDKGGDVKERPAVPEGFLPLTRK